MSFLHKLSFLLRIRPTFVLSDDVFFFLQEKKDHVFEI